MGLAVWHLLLSVQRTLSVIVHMGEEGPGLLLALQDGESVLSKARSLQTWDIQLILMKQGLESKDLIMSCFV